MKALVFVGSSEHSIPLRALALAKHPSLKASSAAWFSRTYHTSNFKQRLVAAS
jgi:hypothetical protein